MVNMLLLAQMAHNSIVLLKCMEQFEGKQHIHDHNIKHRNIFQYQMHWLISLEQEFPNYYMQEHFRWCPAVLINKNNFLKHK